MGKLGYERYTAESTDKTLLWNDTQHFLPPKYTLYTKSSNFAAYMWI
jgi:hypothetical protein